MFEYRKQIMELSQYKDLLDRNTLDAMTGGDTSESRFQSFKICLEAMEKITKANVAKANILELGTCRSFVSGGFEGCNEDDPKYWNANDFSKWDWGAGCFSLIFGQTNCLLTTVDIVDSHIKRCKVMTDSLGIRCNHVVSDSIKFLTETQEKYDLIYLDTGDVHPIGPSIELQLREAMVIDKRNLLNPNGLILIDDVKNKTPREYGEHNNTLGKSQKSIPYLLSQGFIIVFNGYQHIMKKL